MITNTGTPHRTLDRITRITPIRRLGRRDLVVATGRAYIPVLPGRRGRMAGMISLVTTRLVLRRWIGSGSVRDEQQTRAGIEAFERRWDQNGFGMFALELRAWRVDRLHRAAVPQLLPEVMPAVEIGWRLGRLLGAAGWPPKRQQRLFASASSAAAWARSSASRRSATTPRSTSWASSAGAWPGRPSVPRATALAGSTRSPRRSPWRQAQGQRRPDGQASRERAFWEALGGV